MRQVFYKGGVDLDLYALGRNGYMRQIGIDMVTMGDVIMIHPITSKRKRGRAVISIMADDVENFVTALREERDKGNEDRGQDESNPQPDPRI